MSIQGIVSSSPALTRLVMSRVPASVHEGRGTEYAKRVLKCALERTRAYSAFLIENGFDPAEATWENFERLPLTTKKNYIDRYPLPERCIDGDVTRTYVIERSSGASGQPYYWPRLAEQDTYFVPQVDMGFRMFYHIDKVPTLFVVTLALGTWAGGVKMVHVLREIALHRRYPVTVISPGVNLEEILQIVKDLAPSYEQTIMIGYPPFLKTVIDEGAARGIAWDRLNVRLACAGEGFPEEWREHVVDMLGHDPDSDLTSIMGGYGAADLGAGMGQENAFTVLVRRQCLHDPILCRDLFGEDSPPNLFQYDPGSGYIERIDDELVFTVSSAAPLVRYAIRDLGGMLSFEHVVAVMRDHGLDPWNLMTERGYCSGDVWRLPFLYCLGRSDGTVVVGGANVYPENVIAVLANSRDARVLGHKLGLHGGRFVISLECRDGFLGKGEARRLGQEYHRVLVEGLQRVNTEFRDQFHANPRVADPLVEVFAAGTGPFKLDVGRLKRRYTIEERRAA